MDKISKNITYKEAIHSETAKRLGIDNEPTDEQLANMMSIADMIFPKPVLLKVMTPSFVLDHS